MYTNYGGKTSKEHNNSEDLGCMGGYRIADNVAHINLVMNF